MENTLCDTHFVAFSNGLHKYYSAEFRDHQSDHLVIIFSPNSKFAMYNIDFGTSTLFFSDRKLFYYLYNPASQINLLHNFIVACGFTTVTMVGSSKGGAGVLLWSSILSNRCEDAYKVICYSFSPQTKLYPKSKKIKYPSYVGVLKSAETDEGRRKNLQKYGDIKPYVAASKAQTTVIYSRGYEVDRHEAIYLEDTGVTMVDLPLTFHGSITPYLVDKSNPDHLRSIVKKMFRNGAKDADLASTLPDNEDDLFEILDAVSVPYIVDLVTIPNQRSLILSFPWICRWFSW